jgi:prepilin-type N-terminal cleavage/methylation domain-containing protein
VTTTQIKNRGFTLVELLIVIVIIAILTVVSLVAYNGLQNRAKTTAAASAAETVAKKAEIYNTESSGYPANLKTLMEASSDKSYSIGTDVLTGGSKDLDNLTSKPDEANTIAYKACTDNKGARIFYWDYGTNKKQTRTVGTCPATP